MLLGMKWLLTDDVPALVAGLRAAGHEVELAPVAQVCDLDDWDDPRDYPLDVIVRGARPDVFVLVQPVRFLPELDPGVPRQFAFWKVHCQRAREIKGPIGMMLALDEPYTTEAFKNRRVRRCGATPQHVAIYASVDRASAAHMGQKTRAAWWDGSNVDRLVQAVEHAKRGTGYSPRRDGGNWI
jgi:hypothetical protein